MDMTLNSRTEQRQHLNLSNYAYEILVNDIDAFSESGGFSGIINRIISNYMDESEASFSSATEKKRLKLIETLLSEKKSNTSASDKKSAALSSAELKTVTMLVSAYKSTLVERFINNIAPKEKTLKIRLQNEIYDVLGPSVPLPDEEYGSAGNYIKALIEDYASLPFFRREEIYFREFSERINSIIKNVDRPLMTLRIRSTDGTLKDFRIKIYGVSRESDSPYHYLICLSKPVSEPEACYKPAVFRLSRIVKLYDTPSYGSGKITAKEKKALLDAIKLKTVPYILDDVDDYTIELTPDGVKMYKSILHLRPVADVSRTKPLRSGGQVMHFLSTYRQIENYFFKFGKDARIISPKEASESFKNAYLEAGEKYK